MSSSCAWKRRMGAREPLKSCPQSRQRVSGLESAADNSSPACPRSSPKCATNPLAACLGPTRSSRQVFAGESWYLQLGKLANGADFWGPPVDYFAALLSREGENVRHDFLGPRRLKRPQKMLAIFLPSWSLTDPYLGLGSGAASRDHPDVHTPSSTKRVSGGPPDVTRRVCAQVPGP